MQRPAKKQKPGKTLAIVIADDHRMTREALASLLQCEPGIRVVGQCENGKEAVELAGNLRPDAIVMDSKMPVMDGIEATRSIKALWPSIRIIGHSILEESTGGKKMRAAGADEFVSKSGPPEKLLAAIRRTTRPPARGGGGAKNTQIAQR